MSIKLNDPLDNEWEVTKLNRTYQSGHFRCAVKVEELDWTIDVYMSTPGLRSGSETSLFRIPRLDGREDCDAYYYRETTKKPFGCKMEDSLLEAERISRTILVMYESILEADAEKAELTRLREMEEQQKRIEARHGLSTASESTSAGALTVVGPVESSPIVNDKGSWYQKLRAKLGLKSHSSVAIDT